jgi:N-acetylglutamate synthase-like GNAT family acetyltransferase
MEWATSIHVRRARPSDIERIAAFVTSAYSHTRAITREDVLAHFGEAGLTIAETNNELIGLIGWRAENLVARVTDLLVSPAHLCHGATLALLGALEKAASELQCEVVILLMPFSDKADVRKFWSSYGYEPEQIAALPAAWREAAAELETTRENPVYIKKLREQRVSRPM